MSGGPVRGAARLDPILEALPDAVLVVNCNGTVVNANRAALEILQSPGTGLIGRGLLSLLPYFDPSRIPGSPRPTDRPSSRTDGQRMTAHRTDGSELVVEVSSSLTQDEPGYGGSPYGMAPAEGGMLVLIVRDVSASSDLESELGRQQKQTEMILRAAAEGIVGVDRDGRVVLVNPAATRLLGYRASDLGGQELLPLIAHSKPDGSALPAEETPLHDTLRTGRRHRVGRAVLWRKDGSELEVELGTAPVREDGELVGAVMAFSDRSRLTALAGRAEHLATVLQNELQSALARMHQQLADLSSDAGASLWPEANRLLRHLAGESSRVSRIVADMVAHQQLESGREPLHRREVAIDRVLNDAVSIGVQLVGAGRARFAVHTAPFEVVVDGERLAQALGHLIADTVRAQDPSEAERQGSAELRQLTQNGVPTGASVTIAAAKRGDNARIEVRGPALSTESMHLPLARAVIDRHGGVLQSHELPDGGCTYIVELPLVPDGGTDPDRGVREARAARNGGVAALPAGGTDGAGAPAVEPGPAVATGSRPRAVVHVPAQPQPPELRREEGEPSAETDGTGAQTAAGGSGRRRGRPAPEPAEQVEQPHPEQPSEGAGVRQPDGLFGAGEEVPKPRQADGESVRLEPLEQASEQQPAVAAPEQAGPPRPAPQPELPAPGATGTFEVRALGARPAGHDSTFGRGWDFTGGAGTPIANGAADPGATDGGPGSGSHRRTRHRAPEPHLGGHPLPEAPALQPSEPQPLAQQQPAAAPAPQEQQPQPAAPADGVNGTPAARGRRRRALGMPDTAAPPEAPAPGSAEEAEAAAPQLPQPQPESAPAAAEPRPAPPAEEAEDARPDAEEEDDAAFAAGDPHRLLVWPEPDGSTRQALAERGFAPVRVGTAAEVKAQSEAAPAALFVDPLTGPITRTALQSLREASVASGIPVLITAGLGQATREAAYGADPAVLLRAVGPAGRPARVLLVESDPDVAAAFAATLEARGMQVLRAASEADAVAAADEAGVPPDLVVLDLKLIRRRRSGIVGWLRDQNALHRTPLVVYTSVDMSAEEVQRLRSGETVLFLAERSTRADVQSRIVELLRKIGASRPAVHST